MAGYVPYIAQSMVMGIGSRAESLSDIALHLQSAQSSINLISYDFINNQLVYKASVPDDYVGTIYEVGLYNIDANPMSAEFSSRILSTFDSATETWTNLATGNPALFANANNRIGSDSMSLAPVTSSTITYTQKNIFIDLSGYSSADSFSFAYNVANANTSALKFRFLNDASNYYEFSLGSQTAGYKITEVTKGSATVVGTPIWSNITEIQVTATAGSGGGATVDVDAIRIENKDALSLDYILVARKVLASPVTKVAGQAQDIEFTLDVTI
jgi:hypothetical protein